MQNLAENITFFLLKSKVVDIDESEIYVYGFQILISTIIVTGTLLTIGIAINKIILTLGYIITFTILRTFTGGYHAETFRDCFTISITIYLSELSLNILIADNYKIIIGIASMLIAAIIIYRWSPVEHKNNPISLGDKKKYKRISRIIVLIIIILTIIGFFIDETLVDLCFIVSLAVMAVAVLIIIPFFKGGEGYA